MKYNYMVFGESESLPTSMIRLEEVMLAQKDEDGTLIYFKNGKWRKVDLDFSTFLADFKRAVGSIVE